MVLLLLIRPKDPATVYRFRLDYKRYVRPIVLRLLSFPVLRSAYVVACRDFGESFRISSAPENRPIWKRTKLM